MHKIACEKQAILYFTTPFARKNKLFNAFLFKKICSIQKFIVILQREIKKKQKTN